LGADLSRCVGGKAMQNQNHQSTRKTIEQVRAYQAWEKILDVGNNHPASKNDYGTLVRGLAAMIQVNGLAATMAFLSAKSKGSDAQDSKAKAHQLVYEHLSARNKDYLHTQQGDILDFIRDCSTDDYRRATAEMIAYANWLKRYAEAKGWKSSEG
jgi:CRISPR-associated protein Cmr5